ncbi:MAG: DUF3379 family protein [Steroidobacteraceae bacterium]
MTHDEARLLMGAAPAEVSAALAEHLAHCPQCTLFQEQMRHMDHDLSRLFAQPLAPRATATVLTLPITVRAKPKTAAQGLPGVLALAASVVLSVGLSVLFWSLRPQPSLAAGVLGHVALESASWSGVRADDRRRD